LFKFTPPPHPRKHKTPPRTVTRAKSFKTVRRVTRG
jgi:hypothetical protein